MTEITQTDRNAAADCIRQGVSHPPIDLILSGDKDHWFIVQAFARHRLEERAAIVAWLRTASNGSETIKYANVFADEIDAGEHLK